MTDHEPSGARFHDRTHAGHELAVDLGRFLYGQEPVVLAIPPDGVHVAASIAAEMDAPLDVVVSRRIVAPGRPDETLGAVTPDRTLIVNGPLVAELGLSEEAIEELSVPVWAEAQAAQRAYRRGRPYPDLKGRTVLLVDDGLTTGYTVMAAIVATRKMEPSRLIVAAPVASIEAIERLSAQVDEVMALEISSVEPYSVASFYTHYPPITQQDVVWTLDQFWNGRPPRGHSELF